MSWEVQFSPAALRSLDRLPPRIAAAVVEFTTATLPQNPERMSKPLRDELNGLRSARRGDYRVLFSLDHERGVLLVIRLAHRADAFRPR
ncbi:type II toxin-antitoxin system RelE family toxin [Leucobacter massiliensis]|uniref:Addiction module toxin RelE n=1 Tax=Leucobacter massiliensis TaxID=1686285 RepID=A0A2S9QR40_9MICO|nr:type II toxin-antitoxin system RelE/ParE family toxin [Leucobacter massiliensis]PRI12056.1 addiction module toxin RelE [Leucobacter massiliensis]